MTMARTKRNHQNIRQPERVTVKLDKLVPGGQALGTLDNGMKVFVWGALPDEEVVVEIAKKKSHYAEGFVDSLITASPDRIAPRDACFLSTSPWQMMSEEAEIRYKSQLVVEAFQQQMIDLPPKTIQDDGKFYHYRNKMEYSLWYDHDTAKIYPAFHRRGSHQKLALTGRHDSSIERPEIWAEATRIINELNQTGEEARHFQSLVIRCNQAGETSYGLFRMNQPHPDMQTLHDKILGYDYTYSPNGFFQINLPVYEMALKAMQPWINTDRVVDMYAGVGTIGLSVARDRKLTLVETNPFACAEMRKNIPAGHDNIKSVEAKSEEALDFITGDSTIIVDPPRAGLDTKVVARLNEVTPPTIIYLSCNPSTQARDVAALADKYQIVYNQPFNFFPRTPHIENLIVLRAI